MYTIHPENGFILNLTGASSQRYLRPNINEKEMMLEENLVIDHSPWVTWRKQTHWRSCIFAHLSEEEAKGSYPENVFIFFGVLI